MRGSPDRMWTAISVIVAAVLLLWGWLGFQRGNPASYVFWSVCALFLWFTLTATHPPRPLLGTVTFAVIASCCTVTLAYALMVTMPGLQTLILILAAGSEIMSLWLASRVYSILTSLLRRTQGVTDDASSTLDDVG